MELRVLQYFLAVAREQSISGVAQTLHLSQPTLSNQLKAMEEELGKQLLIRGTPGSRKVTLTEEGMILRKRAEEILSLVKRTENEITLSDQAIAGDVYIGAVESDGIPLLTRVAQKVQSEYPHIHFHISRGNGKDVLESLDKGLIDFGLLLQAVDISKYEILEIPGKEHWGGTDAHKFSIGEKETDRSRRSVGQTIDYISPGVFPFTAILLAEARYLRTQCSSDLQPSV